MLISVDDLKTKLLNLPPSEDPVQGVTNFVNAVADFMNQVQAGSGGTPGIFTYDNATAIALFLAMPPTPSNSWIPLFVNALASGVETGIITPGTVTNPIWTASIVDAVTLPSPLATIPTLAVAEALLTEELATIVASQDAPQPMAQALHDYVDAFVFITIGLVLAPPGPPIPVPLPFNAE
jgi:hypothetical protein